MNLFDKDRSDLVATKENLQSAVNLILKHDHNL